MAEKGKVQNLQFFSDLFDNLPFDFWAVSRERKYVFQNSHSMRKWGDMLGREMEELAVSESFREVWHRQLDAVFSGETVNREYRNDDTGQWFKTIIAPVGDDGTYTAAVGVTIEITEDKRREQELRGKTADLESMNRVLKVLVNKQEVQRQTICQELTHNLRQTLLPLLSGLKQNCASVPGCDPFFSSISGVLEDISPVSERSYKTRLTPVERQIVSLIEQGHSSKEIAALLHVAKSTVDTHRNDIRRKIGLKISSRTLKDYILSNQ